MLNHDIISDRSVVRSIKRSHGKSQCFTETLSIVIRYQTIKVHDSVRAWTLRKHDARSSSSRATDNRLNDEA